MFLSKDSSPRWNTCKKITFLLEIGTCDKRLISKKTVIIINFLEIGRKMSKLYL